MPYGSTNADDLGSGHCDILFNHILSHLTSKLKLFKYLSDNFHNYYDDFAHYISKSNLDS